MLRFGLHALLAAAAGSLSAATLPAQAHLLPQVIDGHADFAIHYLARGWSLDTLDIEKGLSGQADVVRWRHGGINGALATVGSDRAPGSTNHFPRLLASLDWFDRLIARHRQALTAAKSAADFEEAAMNGRMALMPAVEGGDQIDSSLANLRLAYARGVRSMGIVYDHHNAIGDGAMTMPASIGIAVPAHGGLSPFGRELIAEMNRLGMVVDLSHAAEQTAVQAMHLSRAPVIFSHSGARALADTPRNLSDDALRELARNGGLVMVPLVPYLTTTAHWRWWSSGEAHYASLEEAGADQAEIDREMAEWDAANPQPVVTLSDVADQVEHIARIAGADHVGIGTDFDGMGSFAIDQLKDASALPQLMAELSRRGWGAADLEKLARGNFLRVLRQVEAVAADQPGIEDGSGGGILRRDLCI